MGKKAKKRKCKKLSSSSSSSEEDEKESKRQDVTSNYKSAKRKTYVNSQESCTAKHENVPTAKDDSQSTRQIKKPVYRLTKTQATDLKPVNTKEEHTKTKSVTVSGSKTVEKRTSKPLNSSTAVTVPQRTETSKSILDKSSYRSTSELKLQLMSPSLVYGEEKEQVQNLLKRKYRGEKPPKTGNDSSTSSSSSVSKDYLRQKRKELVKELCRKHEVLKMEAKRSLCIDAKTPSASTTKQFSTSAKHSTSVSSSNEVKSASSVPGNFTSGSHKTTKSSSPQQQTRSLSSSLHFTFKIPKKAPARPVNTSSENNDEKLKNQTERSESKASVSNSKQENVQPAHSCADASPSFSSQGQDKRSSLSWQRPATLHYVTVPWYDQMRVVKELQHARSEKRLEVKVLQSYGELTCMDIDPPEEGAADAHCKQTHQQDLILVLDTNVLLSHLDYVKKIRSHGLGAQALPVVLIPWVVLQELDSLKKGRGMTGSVAHLATPAISYIYNALKSREPRLWGQSMQQAAESSNGLNAENNDDRVLQCCLQYQTLYPECALILCTNDKNLCSKALLSGVKALSKNDLEAELGRSRHSFHVVQNIETSVQPPLSPQVSTSMLSSSFTPVQPHRQEGTGLSAGLIEKDDQRLTKREDDEKTKGNVSRCVCELEDCLREVLSDVLEVEMKAAYDDLWLEIVYLKPPWTLQDVLQCLKKHWIAVFGQVVPRKKLQTILNLIDFFDSGKTVDCRDTLAALQKAKELVRVFWRSSSRVPSALSAMDNIDNKLQQKGKPPACDVVMNDDDEDNQLTSAQVPHQEVWALFENIWSNVCQISLEVFKALCFDPHTMQCAPPAGSPPPPQDALVCLHRLSSVISQLLQAFSSVLSSTPGLEEVQALLTIIHCNEIANVDSRLTAKDLLDCFSQGEYREKLRVGMNQLIELKRALDHCVRTTGQYITFTT